MKNKRDKSVAVLLLFALLLSVLAPVCRVHVTKADTASTGSLVWGKTAKTLRVGKSKAFTVKGDYAKQDIQWSVGNAEPATISLPSSNTYAKVDYQGRVTGKRVGKVTVTARYGSQTLQYRLKITGKKKIAIDAGHQARGDSRTEPVGPGSSVRKARVAGGATGVSSGVPEYKFTLSVAKKLKKELVKRGYEVYMVRSTNNVNISNKKRAQLANKSGSDIYIRLHGDSIGSTKVQGASAFYPSGSNRYVGHLSKSSKKLTKKLLAAYCKKTGIKNRGISARDDLTGTNWSKIPVVLIEMGFMSNPTEDRKMQKSSFQKKMAVGMANGVDGYFGY